MSTQQYAIGIDLGTTNSLIAVWEDGSPKLIPNSIGDLTTPSAVSIDSDGSVLVGKAAHERRLSHPLQTAVGFKRQMGSDYKFNLGPTHSYSAAELSALILKSLKADAENYLDQAIDEVVISVPAYFTDEQRKHTAFAAELAGLKATRLINEPTAAAMAYGLHNSTDQRVLVFDLGGGTFDVTLLEYSDSVIEVHASTGDNYLGGDDFTQALVDHCLEDWDLQKSNLSPKDLAILLAKSEHFKCLNSEDRSSIQFLYNNNNYIWSPAGDLSSTVWAPLLNRLRIPIESSLRDSKISVKEIDNVVLVGGSTKLKEVQHLVTKMFNQLPLRHINPDTVVALGAATQAACKLRKTEVKEIIMTDVCPYTLGIGVNSHHSNVPDLMFSPIIERNTTIPTSREQTYYTSRDDQDLIHILIFQGERPKALDNLKIGELKTKVPKAPAGQESIRVRFSYDINGLLEVDVTIESTKKTKSCVIDRNPSGLSEFERKASLEKLKSLKIHPRELAPNRTLLARLESAYTLCLEEERENIKIMIESFESVLNKQKPTEIKKLKKQIEQYLESYFKKN